MEHTKTYFFFVKTTHRKLWSVSTAGLQLFLPVQSATVLGYYAPPTPTAQHCLSKVCLLSLIMLSCCTGGRNSPEGKGEQRCNGFQLWCFSYLDLEGKAEISLLSHLGQENARKRGEGAETPLDPEDPLWDLGLSWGEGDKMLPPSLAAATGLQDAMVADLVPPALGMDS